MRAIRSDREHAEIDKTRCLLFDEAKVAAAYAALPSDLRPADVAQSYEELITTFNEGEAGAKGGAEGGGKTGEEGKEGKEGKDGKDGGGGKGGKEAKRRRSLSYVSPSRKGHGVAAKTIAGANGTSRPMAWVVAWSPLGLPLLLPKACGAPCASFVPTYDWQVRRRGRRGRERRRDG
jgi:hypothetical protein